MHEEGIKATTIRRAGVGTGTTSLLVIFTVLCLATLAVLSLSTAVSQQRIHERGVQMTTNLAAAEGEAAEKMAELDDGMLRAWEEASGQDSTEGAYYDSVMLLAQQMGCETDETAHRITITVDIDENNIYVTQLLVLPPGGSARFAVEAQTTVWTSEWEPEEEGEYWTG